MTGTPIVTIISISWTKMMSGGTPISGNLQLVADVKDVLLMFNSFLRMMIEKTQEC